VLIMTSNVGSQYIAGVLDADMTELKRRAMEAVQAHFRPEFLNRIDEMIVFHPLGRQDLRAIVEIQLRNVRSRLTDRKITLEVSDAAKDLLAEAGFDPVYGARPLRRTIQRMLLDQLAQRVLAGEFTEGDVVHVDAKDGELTFIAERGSAVNVDSEEAEPAGAAA